METQFLLVQAWRSQRFAAGLNIGFENMLNLRTIYLQAMMRAIGKELYGGIIKMNMYTEQRIHDTNFR